jgi:hypothetical protein
MNKETLTKITAKAVIKDQYDKQLTRLKKASIDPSMIVQAVEDAMKKLPKASTGSLVIYGDPQSGKTEMMICLTAALLDAGHQIIVHLMNDSVDLLMQNLDRFRIAGLAPAPRNSADLVNSPLTPGQKAILFCKKNSKDLQKLIAELEKLGPLVVIDDEADYATPNAKINQKERTTINELVSQLLGEDGFYIGVTATPARLNLNNTFDNKAETWVNFPPHHQYTGQDTFFPQSGTLAYRLTQLDGSGTEGDVQTALARFLVTVAYLNTKAISEGELEGNYSFLVHTSGKTEDHKNDRKIIEAAMTSLESADGKDFEDFLDVIYTQAEQLFTGSDPDELTSYVVANASRNSFVVLNSKRDRASAGDKPTVPTCPFTVIIGGNIVSRGVTFPNLLAMFFTRDVKTKLQQDTYIQRARMFGARGKYLQHFELTIPEHLYSDWHRCFVFHRLALEAIKNNKVSPVWIGDNRISIAASSSIDRGTVDLNRGEMSFQIFDCPDASALDAIVEAGPTSIETLKSLADIIGEGLPQFLIQYLDSQVKANPDSLAIHKASSIAGYKTTADQETISRTKGFIGNPQLELAKFPNAIHHVKIFYNDQGKARVFYKSRGGAQFVQNLNG